MLTLTITLRNSPHQIVLSFDSYASMKEKCPDGVVFSRQVALEDDYGQQIVLAPDVVAAAQMTDVERSLEAKGKMVILKMRAENDCNSRIMNDPTISFLAGGRGPDFGRT